MGTAKLDDDPEIINKPGDQEGDEEGEEEEHDRSDSEPESDSESGSSDDEDEVGSRKRTKRKFDKILDELKAGKDGDKLICGGFNLTDPTGLKDFLSQNEIYLPKKSAKDMTLLHLIAEEDKGEMPPVRKISGLIKALVQHPANLLAERDDNGKTPLFCAVTNRNHKLVKAMCEAHRDVSSILKISKSVTNPKQSTNCIHQAIGRKSSSRDDDLLKFLIERADDDTLLACDENGLTPLHLAVEYKRCDEGQLHVVEALIERCHKTLDQTYAHPDKGLLSPYLYLELTHEEAKHKEKLATESGRRSEKPRTKDTALKSSHGGKNNLQNKGGEPSKDEQKNAMIPKAPPLEPPRIVQRPGEAPAGKFSSQPNMPDRSRGALARVMSIDESNKKSPKTPADMERGKEKDKESSFKKTRRSKLRPTDASAEGIKKLLKLYYLRNRQHDAAVEFLYGPQQEKQIYFDLVGVAPKIAKGRIIHGLSHLSFEDILQYVAIPRVEVEDDPVKLKPGQHAPEPDGNSRTDMRLLFNWLREEKKVKTILKVIVEDLQEPAHSDEVVETCLTGMGVDIWDWKKRDLSPDVLHRVAPDVQIVHLYWSGNNAILRAWSESEGLKKLPKLKKVHLHTQQGLETRARTKQNVKEFKARMAPIEVQDTKLKGDKTDSASSGLEAVRDPYERHKWITSMEEYAYFLQTAEREGRSDWGEDRDQILSLKYPITVAIIDDGVDVNDQRIQSRLIGGRSFCHRDEEQNLNQPYYVSGGGHGTKMANLICKICPNVKLYILRLDEHFSEPGKRQITARSAAKAVRAAIEKRVDVISMSWTIEKTDRNSEDIKALEEAIKAAASHNILMFCAATDQGAYRDRTYPAATSTKNIFKIGAAEASGAALKWLGDQALVDFIFPGHQIVMEQHDDLKVKSYTPQTGSSVATALASGLAAVILYTVQLAEVSDKSNDVPRYKSLKDHDRMKEAFSQIGTTKESENKYIMVWNRFTRAVKQAESDSRPKDSWIVYIGTLADDLMRRA